MTLDQIRLVHSLLAEGKERWEDAANAILYISQIEAVVENYTEAVSVIQKFKQTLLDNDNYKMAATLLWGPDMFNVEPDCVTRVFNALHDNALVLLMGAASVSKTYSCGAWMLLDWMRDPEFTTIKVISRDEGHLKTNLFAHIWSLFKASVIPLTDNDDANVIYRESELYIGLKSAGPYYGFHGIAVKHSSDSTGDLKGFKPKPMRLSDHPRYGRMSRLRIMADESQNIPAGPFKDFGSIQGSIQGKDLVKIAMAFNPEDMGRTVIQMAEPQQGWLEEDVERLYDWESKQGWHVTRLDGARSENVIAKKVIYPGIQTYEGFLSYLKGDGADTSAMYWCFGRGWPPLKGSSNTIIPASWPNEQRGEAMWLDKPTLGASIDLAFQGADTAQMTIFKWGRAKGWRRANGKVEEFVDRTSPAKKKPRHVMEITQIIQLEKSHDSIQASEEIMGRCNMLGIKPEWVVVDKSGVGLGTFSHLTKYWGNVMGIGWGDGATDMKVLAEDVEPASSRFMGVMSEMWFAFREWLNPAVCAIIINPIIPTTPINIQLTSRRFRYSRNNTMKVESKDEYKARNQRSPDEADSCFVAGTMVKTPSGDRPIESLRIGDEVITPLGVARVCIVHVTEAKNITILKTSDSKTLIGKSAHPVFTWNRGWVRMDRLVLTDQLEPFSGIWKWNILNKLFTADEPIGFKQLVNTIKTGTRVQRSVFYTELSGLRTSARFPMVCMSITKTMIGRIIGRTTLSLKRLPSIPSSIWRFCAKTPTGLKKLEQGKRKLLLRQLTGTRAQMVLRGIRSMESHSTQMQYGTEKRQALPVLSAEANFSHCSPKKPSFALYDARISEPWNSCRKRSVFVRFAERLLSVKKHIGQKHVQGDVQQLSLTEPVKTYNLTLDKHNAYYANGILVDNCIMAVQLVRERGKVLPGMVEQEDSRRNSDPSSETAKLENADEDDSVCASGSMGSDSL